MSGCHPFWMVGLEPRAVQLRLVRPAGFFNRLFGDARRLFLSIKFQDGEGPAVKEWLWSMDDGRTWGPVARMSASSKSVETLDEVELEIKGVTIE